jgi:hypothetical protein
MLARADGKSPVEYMDEDEFQIVRSLAVSLIKDPEQSLAKFVERAAFTMERKA